VQKPYTSVGNLVLNAVDAQTMFIWIECTANPTRLTVKPKQKRLLLHHTKTSSSSPTATTSKTVTALISSTC